MPMTALGCFSFAIAMTSAVWSQWPCVRRITSIVPRSGFSGALGFPVNQGSISTRLPPGVWSSHVAWPNQVSRAPFRDMRSPSLPRVAQTLARGRSGGGDGERRCVAPVTPNWIALAGASTAVVAGSLPPAAAVYLTTLSVAALMGAAFLAYLVAVDDPRPVRLCEAGGCAGAGALLMAGLAVRVPGVVSASAPAGAAK